MQAFQEMSVHIVVYTHRLSNNLIFKFHFEFENLLVFKIIILLIKNFHFKRFHSATIDGSVYPSYKHYGAFLRTVQILPY